MKQIRINSTGETITFTKTAADTNGEMLEFICYLPAGQKAAPPLHIHPLQTEYFECLEGELAVSDGKDKLILKVGQSHLVGANRKHVWFPASQGATTFRTIFRPALNLEWMITERFASMNRSNPAIVKMMEGAYIISRMKGEFYLGRVPIFFQKILFPSLGALAKISGSTKWISPIEEP